MVARRLSITIPLVAAIVGTVTLLVGSYDAVVYRQEVVARHAELEGRMAVEADQLAEALVLPMWNLDATHMRGITASGLAEREIVGVEVAAGDLHLVLARDDDRGVVERAALPATPGLLYADRQVLHGGEPIGSVRVAASPALVEQHLAAWRGRALGLVLALDAGIALAVWALLWLLILRPVKALDRYAESVRSDGRSPPPQARFLGELGTLRDSIAHMLAMLEARYLALHDSEERLKLATRSASIGVWHLDIATDVWTSDELMCRIHGVALPGFVGPRTEWLALAMPGVEAEASAAIDAAIRGERTFSGEFPLRRATGEPCIVVTESTLERDAEGRPIRMVGVVLDVTERRAAEDAVRTLNAELERRVADRTAQLAAALDEGVRAREQAEAATRAKSEFLANMSHEIRTPMNAVLGMTELALRGDLPETTRGYLARAKGAAASLLGLIDGILDFSKIEAGKLEIHREAFGLPELLQRVVSIVGVSAQAKGLPLRWQQDADVPRRLVGDAMRLEQVLVNLCSNAVKFTERGEVSLSVSVVTPASREAGTGSHGGPAGNGERAVCLRFVVRDTGIGMTAAQQSRLFQPFGQLDASTTRQYGGTGLGLAISRRLVELMGGRIEATSEPGRGSEFRFTALFDLALATVEDAPRPPAPSPAPSADALRGRRVLLVEDNELNQIVATELLKIVCGAEVVVADDGEEALARLADDRFDAILMDVQMPGMDGYEVTRRIRRDPVHGRVPIIAMTAHAREEDRERCLASGMNDFVSKPFEPEELSRVLARWVEPAAG
jgi:signal transduction histidine kinase